MASPLLAEDCDLYLLRKATHLERWKSSECMWFPSCAANITEFQTSSWHNWSSKHWRMAGLRLKSRLDAIWSAQDGSMRDMATGRFPYSVTTSPQRILFATRRLYQNSPGGGPRIQV